MCLCALQVTKPLLQEVMDVSFLMDTGLVIDDKKFGLTTTKLRTKICYMQSRSISRVGLPSSSPLALQASESRQVDDGDRVEWP